MPPLDGVHRFQKGEGFVDRSFEGGKKETRKNTNLKRERGGLMKLAGWLDLPSFLSFSPRGRKSRRKTWSCTKFRKCYEEKKTKLECIISLNMPPLDGVHRFQKGEGFVDRSFEGGKKRVTESRRDLNLKRERGGLMKLAGWLDLE